MLLPVDPTAAMHRAVVKALCVASALTCTIVVDGADISNEHRMRDVDGNEMDSHMQDIHRWSADGPWYM